jgi:hypothetical protein
MRNFPIWWTIAACALVGALPSPAAAEGPLPEVRLNGNYFQRNGRPFIPTGVHWVPAKAAMQWPMEWDPASVEADFRKMRELGVNTVRLDLVWAWFEPRPGDYNPAAFAQLDELVKLARRYEIYLQPSLFIGNEVGEASGTCPGATGVIRTRIRRCCAWKPTLPRSSDAVTRTRPRLRVGISPTSRRSGTRAKRPMRWPSTGPADRGRHPAHRFLAPDRGGDRRAGDRARSIPSRQHPERGRLPQRPSVSGLQPGALSRSAAGRADDVCRAFPGGSLRRRGQACHGAGDGRLFGAADAGPDRTLLARQPVLGAGSRRQRLPAVVLHGCGSGDLPADSVPPCAARDSVRADHLGRNTTALPGPSSATSAS